MSTEHGARSLATDAGAVSIRRERIGADEYIEFLSRTDLGQQYPKERFRERVAKLVKNAAISLIARNERGAIVGACFGLTDFAYWLLVTDLGIDRAYVKRGIGRAMMDLARETAGGQKDIIVFVYANEDAAGFYEKVGMRRSRDMMELTDIEWTPFEVGQDEAQGI